MLGNDRLINIEQLNFLYNEQKEVCFVQIEQQEISDMYQNIRALGKDIRENYEHEDYLIELFVEMRKVLNRFYTSLESYDAFFELYLNGLLEKFKIMKVQYEDLFKAYVESIVKALIYIKNNYAQQNFIAQELAKRIHPTSHQCIVTQFKSNLTEISGVPVLRATEYIKGSEFYGEVFVIGTPDFYDERIKNVFLAKETYFISYNIFKNKINKQKPFKNLKQKDLVDLQFKNIRVQRGFDGQVFNEDLGKQKLDEFLKEEILKRYQEEAKNLDVIDQVEAKLVILRNNYYIFVPIDTEIRKIDCETLEISKAPIKDIHVGDWLLFRNNTNSDLVIEIANQILGEVHHKYRNNQRAWKKRLHRLVKGRDFNQVIRYLNKYDVKNVTPQNVRNWLKEGSISMQQFEELLTALKFTESERTIIKNTSSKLKSAHLKAGRNISKILLEGIDQAVIEDLQENGYATFTTPKVKGASFNIEVIDEIHSDTILVDNNNILRILKG